MNEEHLVAIGTIARWLEDARLELKGIDLAPQSSRELSGRLEEIKRLAELAYLFAVELTACDAKEYGV